VRRLVLVLTLAAGCALSSDTNENQAHRPDDESARDQPAASSQSVVSPPSPDPSRPNADDNQKPTHDLREFLIERGFDPMTWFTFGLLVLALFQYWAMKEQGDEMRASIAEATRSATAIDGRECHLF
jgi:hypothetical protein